MSTPGQGKGGGRPAKWRRLEDREDHSIDPGNHTLHLPHYILDDIRRLGDSPEIYLLKKVRADLEQRPDLTDRLERYHLQETFELQQKARTVSRRATLSGIIHKWIGTVPGRPALLQKIERFEAGEDRVRPDLQDACNQIRKFARKPPHNTKIDPTPKNLVEWFRQNPHLRSDPAASRHGGTQEGELGEEAVP